MNEMAALDGKITIESGLRPCKIYNPQSIGECEAGVDVSEYLSDKNKRHASGLFHCWCYHKNPLGENSPYGKLTTVSHMFGVIEFENGCVKEIPLWQIRFMDNAMSEYPFPEMEKCNG